MPRKQNYYLGPLVGPEPETAILVSYPAEYVPVSLAVLEMRKNRALWLSDSDFSNGLQGINHAQWGLLMDARADIIEEIRHARGSIPAGAALDLETYPVGTFPGIQLADIVGSLNTNGESAAFILAEIRTILQAQGTGEQGQLDALLQIVALLTA